jgi:hypothetical protein
MTSALVLMSAYGLHAGFDVGGVHAHVRARVWVRVW